MPKVELHVHLEGSIRPKTLLELAKRNGVTLPADTVEGLEQWYQFRDFNHFVEVYVAVTQCIKNADDIELVAREFLDGQKAQKVLHTEFTYSASTLVTHCGIPWEKQHAALEKALRYGEKELGITAGIILDIVRGHSLEEAMDVASWAAESPDVVALGLAGTESLGTTQYQAAFDYAHAKGMPVIPHAGEHQGPESIRACLDCCQPPRIGHGVRVVEDPVMMAEIRDRRILLEVCPTSNVCLGVYPTLEAHPLPKLLDTGIVATINSDDPPMFGTTISDEFARCAKAFEFNEDVLWSLSLAAANGSLLHDEKKRDLLSRMREGFNELTS